MDKTEFQNLLGRLSAGDDLSQQEMAQTIHAFMQGTFPDEQIGLFLTALAAKGETVAEVAGAATAMREHMLPIQHRQMTLLDTCGTGGGGSKIFNVSTSAAIVAAAAGVPVAKHGNRSFTSKSGSADVLALLGVNIDATIEQVSNCLDQLGLCFCFAPSFHPAMRHVSPARKALGTRTIFNILGPLSNPAGAQYQLLGTGIESLRPLLAEVLAMLGTKRALVVSGEDGLGEVTLTGKTFVTEVQDGQTRELVWTPSDFGLKEASLDDITIEGPEDSAAMIRDVLAGSAGKHRDMVLLNAAAALIATGRVDDPKRGVEVAAHAIDSGTASEMLKQLAIISHG